MGFDKHQKNTGRGGSSKPEISLRKSGSIGINSTAYEEYFDGEDGVILYYNEEENQIGVKPADKEEKDAYTLQFSEGSKGAGVNAGGFLNQYDLVPEETTRYEAAWHVEEDLIYIELD